MTVLNNDNIPNIIDSNTDAHNSYKFIEILLNTNRIEG